MYITIDQCDIIYDTIRSSAASAQGAETVVIFVGPDIDALCACKLLVSQLRNDYISHRVIPITTYSQLESHTVDLVHNSTDCSSIILLNCGGHMNILDILPELLDHQRIYVFESRRPLHLNNLFANDKVWVVDDGHVDSSLSQQRDAHLACTLHPFADDERSPSPETGSPDDPSVDSLFAAQPSSPCIPSSADDKENAQTPRKAPPPPAYDDETDTAHDPLPTMSIRTAQHILTEYYTQGSYTGMSIAKTMFELVNLLGRAQVTDCWFAGIALASYVQSEDISMAMYQSMLNDLDVHIARLASSSSLITRIVQDWRLPLYRHWSLMDAFCNARGPCTRLATWTEPGVSKLRYMFAKLGIPLDECHKPFIHLSKRVRHVLASSLSVTSSLIGLDYLEWPVLTRTTTSGTCVTTADMVYVLNALAVYPSIASMRDPAAVLSDQGLPSSLLTNTADAFFVMMAALDTDGYVAGGLEASKLMVPSIMRIAGHLIARKSIKTIRRLRYVLVNDPDGVLQSVSGVKELLLVLTAALRHVGHTDLPLIVGVLQSTTSTAGAEDLYLLVGHAGASHEDYVRRNQLDMAFQLAADSAHARHSHDAFDPRVIWVVKDDVTDFIEMLQFHLRDEDFGSS